MKRALEVENVEKRRARESGVLLVEMAFVLPLLAIVFLIIIDGGLAVREHQLLQNAAREAARFASLPPGASPAEIRQRVVTYCAEENIPVNPANVAINKSVLIPIGGGFFAQGTEVTVSYTKQMLILGAPLLPSGNITLTGRSVFRNLY